MSKDIIHLFEQFAAVPLPEVKGFDMGIVQRPAHSILDALP